MNAARLQEQLKQRQSLILAAVDECPLGQYYLEAAALLLGQIAVANHRLVAHPELACICANCGGTIPDDLMEQNPERLLCVVCEQSHGSELSSRTRYIIVLVRQRQATHNDGAAFLGQGLA